MKRAVQAEDAFDFYGRCHSGGDRLLGGGPEGLDTGAAGRRFENLEPFDVTAYHGAIERFRSELNHMVARITWDYDF